MKKRSEISNEQTFTNFTVHSIPSETKIENADVVKICNVSKENISVTNVSIHFEL
jgi:hypothetical protein